MKSKVLKFTLVFYSDSLPLMVKRPKKSGQKQKEQDEIKSITYHLNRAFIEVNETNFFGR